VPPAARSPDPQRTPTPTSCNDRRYAASAEITRFLAIGNKGFSLHAGVSFGALDRKGRERLVRYCTRPPLAMERLSVLRDGSVAYKLKWANKRSSHRVMSPRFRETGVEKRPTDQERTGQWGNMQLEMANRWR